MECNKDCGNFLDEEFYYDPENRRDRLEWRRCNFRGWCNKTYHPSRAVRKNDNCLLGM
ncbi:hypothetical protein LCGC14_1397330 [marine sediment metagenome]|uniref:Uncharacterized protein n=1 Tax=marine sediment metagenome TaxID=412755 RepID=A0A0F9JY57_9ZZZZ